MQHAKFEIVEEVAAHRRRLPALLAQLISADVINARTAFVAQRQSSQFGVSLSRLLPKEFHVSQGDIADAQGRCWGTQVIDPTAEPPDPKLITQFGAQACLHRSVLPWRDIGAATAILTTDPAQFSRHIKILEATFGPVVMAITTQDHLEQCIRNLSDETLIFAAEHHLSEEMSCRNWSGTNAQRNTLLVAVLLCLAGFFIPNAIFGLVYGWLVVILTVSTALKCGAICCAHRAAPPNDPDVIPVRLPTITLLVPLFQERQIAAHLIHNLQKLNYPRALLDVCLVVEEDDSTTQDALGDLAVPTWMRVLVVPMGMLRTKPRALNYAMNFAHGSIIGVYDAEDAPDPDQLRTVAAMFANADPSVACVQGSLDYFNARSNWLARCFAIEYASWFRVVLPGYARMGLVVPLGGTTLFFKREILDKLGGWDAHNVTEDADLGVRLARRGYRTVFMQSVTQEEANARLWPWIKQRSRWLKGYAVTFAVHMRRPRTLLQDLGIWRFFGFQILFLGTLSQFLLAPLLWSIVLIPFGFTHPALEFLSPFAFMVLTGLFLTSAAVNLASNCIGVHCAGKRWLMIWAPTLIFYFPLATIGAIKGLSELLWRPFYWDKTAHGVDLPR